MVIEDPTVGPLNYLKTSVSVYTVWTSETLIFWLVNLNTDWLNDRRPSTSSRGRGVVNGRRPSTSSRGRGVAAGHHSSPALGDSGRRLVAAGHPLRTLFWLPSPSRRRRWPQNTLSHAERERPGRGARGRRVSKLRTTHYKLRPKYMVDCRTWSRPFVATPVLYSSLW